MFILAKLVVLYSQNQQFFEGQQKWAAKQNNKWLMNKMRGKLLFLKHEVVSSPYMGMKPPVT